MFVYITVAFYTHTAQSRQMQTYGLSACKSHQSVLVHRMCVKDAYRPYRCTIPFNFLIRT